MKKNSDTKQRNEILEHINTDFEISRGKPYPYGATLVRDGINFAVYSPVAKSISLVIFGECEKDILFEFPLDNRYNRTGNIWHAYIKGLDAGISYGYRIIEFQNDIKNIPDLSSEIILLDPYTRATCGGEKWGDPYQITRNDKKHTFRLSIIPENDFDWDFDQPLNIPLRDTIIYELHVRGFTKHKSSGVEHPGTYMGLIEKIPYLKELGITAVELLPVTDFDETYNERINPITGERLKNFWGYDPISYFSPKAAYAVNGKDGQQVNEFRTLVKHLHKAGIEVILDMVFNHTGEAGRKGPIYHFKGLDNAVYYLLDPKTGAYLDYSGCGNTVNCNHPVVRELILQSLRYWVTEMHVDGFRFDLASILGRGRDGKVLSDPPLIERIAEDPILANTKLIAEAWDAAGLYQVGDFPHWKRWMEWNGKFRDDVRLFLRGAKNMVANLGTRLAGSSDLYQDDGREPYHSVNFVTAHDGFTLHDLVTYNKKHNDMNGENNRDGSDYNLSWNCGVEGETDDKNIVRLRDKQQRNFAALLLLSQGVPMILAGDEFGRTQSGNNNAYCQDNDISWIDWSLTEKNKDLLRFFKLLIKFRKTHNKLRRKSFDVKQINGQDEMSWHGRQLNQPDWSAQSKTLAIYYAPQPEDGDQNIFILINGSDEAAEFELPVLKRSVKWLRVMDTHLEAPLDFMDEGGEVLLDKQSHYNCGAHAIAMLIGK